MALPLRNSRLLSVGLASVVAIGVIGVGSVALADSPPSTPGGTSAEARHEGALKHGIGNVLKDSGVTREEIKEGTAAGLTLGQIIDQYGDISAEQAKANALAALSDRLEAAVADGKITQDKADEIAANAPAAIDRLLAAVPGEHHEGKKPGARILKAAKHSLETVAEVLGTDPAALREQLASGQTIADIAGPQTQAVIDALVADANAAIDEAVANGRMPADKADEAKARAAAAIERFVNEGRPDRPHGKIRERIGAARGR